MSAAGRGPRGGGAHDNFPTPSWAVHRFLEAWVKPLKPGGQVALGPWLEPGAGDGAIVRAAQDWFEREGLLQPPWVVTEVREECREALSRLPHLAGPPIIGDFLSDDGTERVFDVCLANPPYKLAMEFLEVALRRARRVAFLLRLNFLESEGRHGFLATNVPDVYVLPQRPSFDGKGTDATSYAWMVWDAEDPKKRGTVRILDLTAEEERNRDRPPVVRVPAHRWKVGGSEGDLDIDVCTRAPCRARRAALGHEGSRWRYATERIGHRWDWKEEKPPCIGEAKAKRSSKAKVETEEG